MSNPDRGAPFVLHRFQVNKTVKEFLLKKHPWIYRKQCSSALQALPIGSLVRLVGPQNEFLALGIYEPLSVVAIRVFSFLDVAPDAEHFKAALLQKWQQRMHKTKVQSLEGFRWIHGEVDGFPGLNIDVYRDVAVVVFYLQAWRTRLQDILSELAPSLGLKAVYCKEPHGQVALTHEKKLYELVQKTWADVPEPFWFQEGDWQYPVFPLSGQKTGFYLDLRNVRREILTCDLRGARVLNLFANTGVLSGLAEKQGAAKVISVEASAKCAQQFHNLQTVWQLDANKQQWVQADVWEYLKSEVPPAQTGFDLIILDPPSLAKRSETANQLQKIWMTLVKAVTKKLNPSAHFLSICCTERISENQHQEWTLQAAKQVQVKLKLIKKLPTAFDHPAHPVLRERDYFHAYHWRVV